MSKQVNKAQKSDYKGVSFNHRLQVSCRKKWVGQVKSRSSRMFATEKEAAKYVDLEYIKMGLDAPNGFYTRKK